MIDTASNTALLAELDLLARARRHPAASPPAAAVAAGAIAHAIVNASTAGDNILISPPGQQLAIVEILLINNVGAQTIVLRDGPMALMQITNAAPPYGFFLGYAAEGKPHFVVSAGNPFVLNLSAGSQVDGFVKYQSL